METKLMELRISGFKGIHDVTIPFAGHSVMIAGENGTGKTSVYDAFLWLLTGKDSAGNVPAVKPVDENGSPVAGRDCDVEAVLWVDGKSVNLHRQLHEVWSKGRDTGEKTYARDETLCWINDIPKKVDREYTPEVVALLGGDDVLFRLLTNHTAFMAMNWADRRRKLIDLTGEAVTVPGFASIESILNGATPEDAKKRLLVQRRRYQEQLDQIPARMDELQRTLAGVSEAEYHTAQNALAQIDDEICGIDSLLVGAAGDRDERSSLLQTKAALLSSRADAAAKLDADRRKAVWDAQAAYETAKNVVETITVNLTATARRLAENNSGLEETDRRRAAQLAAYKKAKSETYTPLFPDMLVCPTCGQPLPEKIAAGKEEERHKQWQAAHDSEISAMLGKGMELKKAVEEAREKSAGLTRRSEALRGDLAHAEKTLQESEAQLAAAQAQEAPTTSPEIEQLDAEIAKAEAAMATVGTNEQAEGWIARKAQLNAAKDSQKAVLARYEAVMRNKARLAQLEAEKADTGKLLAGVEKSLYTLGEYVSARCRLLEENINAYFTTIRWRLFDIRKNGEIRDTCDATVNGVPYGAGLNNAAEINAGIEIIKVFSNAYRLHLPCFVDNAESVNHIAQTGGQMVLLTVTDDEALTCTVIAEERAPQNAVVNAAAEEDPF